MVLARRTRSNIARGVWLIAWAGLGLVLFNHQADGSSLTQADVKMAISIREMADRLREDALTQAAKDDAGKKKSFNESMIEIQRIGQEADERACRHHGVTMREYRMILRRMVNVGDLMALETARDELEVDLQKRQSITANEAELQVEAERQRASTEEWFRQLKAKRASDKTTSIEKANPSDNVIKGRKKPALHDDYSDSIEQIVMKPMREQVESGAWVESIKQANKHRIEEIRQQISKINLQLATPSMRQAEADKSVVTAVLDAKTLQGLRGSLIEELPTEPGRK